MRNKNRFGDSYAGASSTPNDDEKELDLTIRPATVFRLLVMLVLGLSAVGMAANIVIYQVAPHPEHKIARLAQRFDLGHEPSIPAWYSSLALVACSFLLATIGVGCMQAKGRYVLHWFGLAAVFFLMAIDEAVMFHEMVDNALHDLLDTTGVFYFAWVIPGGLFVMFVALACGRFLLDLDRRTRWLFIGSGGMFVFGAIGMEMAAGVIVPSWGVESIAHTISQTIEESCEMLGIALFIYALLDYLGHNFDSIRISTSNAGAAVAAAPLQHTTSADHLPNAALHGKHA